jgi:hypothetical protein
MAFFSAGDMELEDADLDFVGTYSSFGCSAL